MHYKLLFAETKSRAAAENPSFCKCQQMLFAQLSASHCRGCRFVSFHHSVSAANKVNQVSMAIAAGGEAVLVNGTWGGVAFLRAQKQPMREHLPPPVLK